VPVGLKRLRYTLFFDRQEGVGSPEIYIARLTNHTIDSVGCYLENHKNVKMLLEKGFNLMEIVRVGGMGRSTVIQYRDLVWIHHEELRGKAEEASSHSGERRTSPRKRSKAQKA
jgi:hypothetical protein